MILRTRGFSIHIWGAMILFLLFAPMAIGQVTNVAITGSVTDSTGAAVPNAHIRVRNLATNATEDVESNSLGVYTAGQLLPGRYSITTERDGFKKNVESGITLTIGQTATVNITLQVGDVNQTVTVTGGEELIDTADAQISQVVDQHAITELPLNGRNPASLVLLATGTSNVLNSPTAGKLQAGTTMPSETGASAGGGRQGSTYYLLDGVPNMDTYDLLAAPFPNSDATQEFRIISNNFDARYGYAPSAVVSIQTKSGTNAIHGGLFEFIRNSDLNAGNYFTHAVDSLKRNQFGGFVGGPIRKNKLFYFINYQQTTERSTPATNVTFTPTQAMLNGDFSAVPLTLKAPFATINGKPNQIDPSKFNQAAVRIATTALPLGQVAATGQTTYVGAPLNDNYYEGTGRLDYTVNDSQRLFLRSFTQRYDQIGSSVKGNLLAWQRGGPATYLNEALGHTWAINPKTVNNVTLFWNELHSISTAQTEDSAGNSICMSKYINVAEPPGVCSIEGFQVVGGFNSGYYEPIDENRRTLGFSEAFTRQIGSRHSFTAGVDLWRQFAEENVDYPNLPIVIMANTYTGFGLSDFLMGDVVQFQQGAGELVAVKGWQFGIYAQDQFRASPSLTITAGIRWDPNFPPHSVGNRGSAFHPGQQSTVFPNAPTGMVFAGDRGVDASFMPTTYGYFEPRIGFSWQPNFSKGTAIRGGFGMFTGPLQYSSYNHMVDIAPYAPSFTLTGGVAPISFSNPWASFPTGVSPFPPFAAFNNKPPTNSTFQTPVSLGQVFAPNFRLPMTQAWNISVDQEFAKNYALHLAYVASQSYHLSTVVDQNPGYYTVVNGEATGVRNNYPSFSQILQVDSLGTSSYQSLQAQVEKRLSYGLQFQGDFTWSKTIDISSNGDTAWISSVGDPFDIRHNRGLSDLNVPITWTSNVIYTSPALKSSNAIVRQALGAWELGTIYRWQSGLPFSIAGGANGSDNSWSYESGDRADVVPGVTPCVKCGGRQNWLQHYISAGAFQANAPGTFGNSGRNIFKGVPINSADALIAKNWPIRERYTLQFRWEMFNALNHPSFATPGNDPTNPGTFGKITSIGTVPPRVMQGALKFTF